MNVTLNLRPEVETGLLEHARVAGLSVEEYLGDLVARVFQPAETGAADTQGSGMVTENGLLVYRTGRPLPAQIVDDAIRRSREERSRSILGDVA